MSSVTSVTACNKSQKGSSNNRSIFDTDSKDPCYIFDSWECTLPSSYTEDVYIPNLGCDLNPGSFVIVRKKNYSLSVARVVTASIAVNVPINELPSTASKYTGDLIKVNLFPNIDVLDKWQVLRPPLNENTSLIGVTEIFQSDTYQWVYPGEVCDVAFVLSEDDLTNDDYDISFMANAFVLRYRCKTPSSTGMGSDLHKNLQSIPASFPILPFASSYLSFRRRYRKICYPASVMQGFDTIRLCMQKMLCRVSMNQGNKNHDNVKITNECFFYIQYKCTHAVTEKKTAPFKKVKFGHGLSYCPKRKTKTVFDISFFTAEAVKQLRTCIGGASIGYGVRKKQPRYDAPPEDCHLHIPDQLNVVDCWNNHNRDRRDQRGIVFSYNCKTGDLRINVCYSLKVLSKDNIHECRLHELGVSICTVRPSIDMRDLVHIDAEFFYEDFEGFHEYPLARYLYRVVHVERTELHADLYLIVHEDGRAKRPSPNTCCRKVFGIDDYELVTQAIADRSLELSM